MTATTTTTTTTTTTALPSKWPKPKLYMPWTELQEECCFIQYDSVRKLLQVVHDETNNNNNKVIHVFNPLDIIGVDVEIKLFDTGPQRTAFCNATAAAFNTTSDGPSSPVGDNAPATAAAAGCNIFQSVNENKDYIFNRRQDNDVIPVNSHAAAILNVYSYPKAPKQSTTISSLFCSTPKQPKGPNPHYNDQNQNNTGPRYACHYAFPVAPAHDFELVSELVKCIRIVAQLPSYNNNNNNNNDNNNNDEQRQKKAQSKPKLRKSPPKVMVLINPKSGSGKGLSVWKSLVQPMLEEQAGMDCSTVLVTEYPMHARDYIISYGKKTLQESQSQSQDQPPQLLEYDAIVCLGGDGILYEVFQGWQARDDYPAILKKIKIGIVGCGTCNGLAKSLTHEAEEYHSQLASTFMIARGQTIPMDLSTYTTSVGNTYTSFLTFSWAMIADIDINSEVLRCLGSLRIDIWGALCALSLTRYRGRFSYLPPPPPSSSSLEEEHEIDHGTKNKNNNINPSISMPSLQDPVPSDWKVIEDDFLLFFCSQVSHSGERVYSSPPSSMTDGVFQIMLVRGTKIGRIAMAHILLSLDSGAHVSHPAVEFIPCIAYRLEPISSGSYNDLDGEVIDAGPIQAQIMPAAVSVFGTTSEKKNQQQQQQQEKKNKQQQQPYKKNKTA